MHFVDVMAVDNLSKYTLQDIESKIVKAKVQLICLRRYHVCQITHTPIHTQQ
jgi:hypothetical protein